MLVDAALVGHLQRREVPFALIGGVALAAWGVARFTADVDLLTLDARVLHGEFWEGSGLPVSVIRVGDADDPLGGIVRLALDPPHDLVLGRSRASQVALERSVTRAGLPCAVADPLGLCLLKLEAGSPQDAYDVLALLHAAPTLSFPDLETRIGAFLPALSDHARAAWGKIQFLRSS